MDQMIVVPLTSGGIGAAVGIGRVEALAWERMVFLAAVPGRHPTMPDTQMTGHPDDRTPR